MVCGIREEGPDHRSEDTCSGERCGWRCANRRSTRELLGEGQSPTGGRSETPWQHTAARSRGLESEGSQCRERFVGDQPAECAAMPGLHRWYLPVSRGIALVPGGMGQDVCLQPMFGQPSPGGPSLYQSISRYPEASIRATHGCGWKRRRQRGQRQEQ